MVQHVGKFLRKNTPKFVHFVTEGTDGGFQSVKCCKGRGRGR